MIGGNVPIFYTHSLYDSLVFIERLYPGLFKVMQITLPFSHTNQPSVEDLIKSRMFLKQKNIKLIIHSCLRYNPCGSVDGSNDPNFSSKLNYTIRGMTEELDIAAVLNAGVVLHIGTSKNKQQGLNTCIKSYENMLCNNSKYTLIFAKAMNVNIKSMKAKRMLILENSANDGNKLGFSIEEIANIFSSIEKKYLQQIRLCLDTAHTFGAGIYNFGEKSQVDKIIKDLQSLDLLKYVKVIHLNDSQVTHGSKKDRHAPLCKGHQFTKETLEYFISKFSPLKIPFVCETPSKYKSLDGETYSSYVVDDVQLLYSLGN